MVSSMRRSGASSGVSPAKTRGLPPVVQNLSQDQPPRMSPRSPFKIERSHMNQARVRHRGGNCLLIRHPPPETEIRHQSANLHTLSELRCLAHLWPCKDSPRAASTQSEHMRKAEGARVDRLKDVLRAGESSDDLLLLLRGGEATSAKLLRQAALLRPATPTAASVRVGYHSSLRAARSTSWPCSNRAPDLPEVPPRARGRACRNRVLLPTSKRLAGPSCSGRLAEPVGPRKSC